MIFSSGLEVFYKDLYGTVNFICDTYITITVVKGKYPNGDVNVLIYRKDWKEVRLVKESSK
jgi:hypothetical protein